MLGRKAWAWGSSLGSPELSGVNSQAPGAHAPGRTVNKSSHGEHCGKEPEVGVGGCHLSRGNPGGLL